MQQALGLLHVYRQKRISFYQWRTQAGFWQLLALAGALAALTGLLAQVRIYLPWTPIPIVASQLGVILAAVLLGKRWGAASMGLYALGGLLGIPWFAGWNGGLAALAGPTGGYILGYILAALFMGHILDSKPGTRRLLPLSMVILFAQLVLLYIPGLIHFYLWLNLAGSQVTLLNLLWLGYIPFIAGDVVKSLVGALIARSVSPMD
ncbi:MAG: biotin transporter BioY [Peptococcaceae bacterium]|jgi:biotin transport system substrate-specific component|nr:biotin transporter BioY [Peptococcaceae bacterium]